MKINVLCHTYYGELDELFQLKKSNKPNLDFEYYFNVCSENIDSNKIVSDIKQNCPNAIIAKSSNVGKDIGGKLLLIDLAMQLGSAADFYIFLHDKKSPHTTLGDTWRKKLFKIIESNAINTIAALFKSDKKIGIVASKEFINNEYDKKSSTFESTNNKILKELIVKHKFNLNEFDFVGGTMFWVRSEIINSFFKENNPLAIRATLEKGNILDHVNGTYAHSWERMLSWIALNQGYYIKGI